MTLTTELSDMPDMADPETFKPGVPHDVYDRLRSLPGLPWQPAESGTLTGGFWLVTRYDDAVEVLQDPDRFCSRFGAVYPLPNPTGEGAMGKHILFMDPPDHSRVRRSAAKSFGPRVVANFESWIRDVVVETLDEAMPKGRFDWVQEVADIIPPRVVARILGVPPERRGYIVEATAETFKAQKVDDGGASLNKSMMEVGEYLTRLGEEKLQNPADDMTTVLAKSLQNGEIDLAEYQLYMASLLTGGAETTSTTFSHMAHLLASDPAVRAATDRGMAEGRTAEVVDEFIRYISPAMRFVRVATRDTEVGGQAIKKNDVVAVVLTAANRDPAAFPRPHEFDPFREGPKPAAGTGGAGLAFSAGPHRCIAHVLAKLEVRILLEEMYARKVVLAMDGEAERGPHGVVNVLTSVPVTVTVG